MLLTVILFLAVLSLLVFFHELGHFVTAKKIGMKIDEFGFGFPPRAFGIMRVRGEERRLVEETEEVVVGTEETVGTGGIELVQTKVTDVIRDTVEVRPINRWKFIWGGSDQHEDQTIYSINWIPLGGFVKIHGESGELKNDPRSFSSRPIWQRFIVLIAGVAMNFAFAAVLLSIGFAVGLPSIVDESVPTSVKLANEKIQIMSVIAGSPAERAGMETSDEILSIDDQIFTSSEAARTYIKTREGEEVKFLLKRGDEALTFSVTAEDLPTYGEKGVGVGLVKTALVSYPWYLAAIKGVEATFVFTWEVLKAFGNLLWNLVVHQSVAVDLAGPVGIAVMTGQAAAMGILYLLQFAAILSINLAVVNILPFPALDGGRIFFLIIEKIRGRALDERFEALAHNLGFALLLLLVAVVTFRDIFKFVG
ncbi:MAG: RIP metalloprotease RseP [Patescibacteria group bacterium]|jgi:regulator of sigma E protease